MRITAAQRTANENRIRAAMDRLLRGEIPPGGRCDITTLQQAGDQPDPRDAQITRLKTEITGLKNGVVESTSTINQLTEFQTQALARLAAQHDEIIRLPAAATSASRVSRLPQRAATIGSCN